VYNGGRFVEYRVLFFRLLLVGFYAELLVIGNYVDVIPGADGSNISDL
jgi:hypothetical protein